VAVEEQAPEAVDRTASGAAGKPSHVVRRSFLGGLFGAVVGGGGYLVTAGVLPGRTTLFETLGLDGSDGELPRVEPGELHIGTFRSAARGDADTGWVLALPPGAAFDRLKAPGRQPLPVCVLLHGRGDSATSLVDIGYDRFLAGATMTGMPPFAIAAVDGGDRYWHRRSAGDDTGRMIVDELLPMLARAGLRTEPRDRVALMGYSMGGYGALLLASELGPARVAAVVAESPAVDGAGPGRGRGLRRHRRLRPQRRLRPPQGARRDPDQDRLRPRGPVLPGRQGVRRGPEPGPGRHLRPGRPRLRVLALGGGVLDRLRRPGARPRLRHTSHPGGTRSSGHRPAGGPPFDEGHSST
jgi:hypothetical protein